MFHISIDARIYIYNHLVTEIDMSHIMSSRISVTRFLEIAYTLAMFTLFSLVLCSTETIARTYIWPTEVNLEVNTMARALKVDPFISFLSGKFVKHGDCSVTCPGKSQALGVFERE